jgi:hypothetical protein
VPAKKIAIGIYRIKNIYRFTGRLGVFGGTALNTRYSLSPCWTGFTASSVQ